jgi:APA family basic amino acid/polyamine antiporter
MTAKLVFFGWAALGLVFYYLYGRTRSNVARGINEAHELDGDVPPLGVPPMPGAPSPGGRDA